MPIFKYVNKNFFKKWSKEMAYVLGFFAADGYMTLNKRGACFWNIQITDKGLLEEIKKTIKSNHKISIRVGKGNNSDIFRLQIGSKEMYEDLEKLGMKQNKTKSLVIPNVPNNFLKDFVRGYFDGDGNVWSGIAHKERKTKTLTIQTAFTSCSGNFLLLLKQRLENFGIIGGSFIKGKSGYFRLVYSAKGSLNLYNFMYNRVGTSNLFLKRKKDVFERYKSMRL